MNDEIKEILDDIRFVAEEPSILEEVNEDGEEYMKEYDNFVYLLHNKAKLLYDYITNLQQENKKLKRKLTIKKLFKKYKVEKDENLELRKIFELQRRIEKAIKDLFELKDMIYKPETRDENIPIQQKISSIIKQLNGRSDE